MQDEIALSTDEELSPDGTPKRNTGVRYEKKGANYGMLQQDVYTVKDLSLIIGVHTTTILEHIKNGKLKALYLGGPAGYRLGRQEIIDWISNVHQHK